MNPKDFYLDDRALAGYVEKDWYDHILKSNPRKSAFEFSPFEREDLYCDYHERLIEFLLSASNKAAVKPRKLLEVGASLGRTFYEACRKIETIRSATLIEPSQNLFSTHGKIFDGDEIAQVPVLKGNLSMEEVPLLTAPIKAACSGVDVVRINRPFQEVDQNLGTFDLVICSNVIDQCKDHLRLAGFLKRSTSPSGLILLSCTYQWNEKYIGNASDPVKDINDLFDSSWTFQGEANLPFRIRVNERYWMSFLSHVVAYQFVPT
jgi:hypothetical protein